MKKKIYKIMGVALTLVMVLSLFAFTAAPVAADPDENEWSKFKYPEEKADSDWFFDETMSYVGPIAMTVDGEVLYCAADPTVAGQDTEHHLMKSEDGGRTWSVTDYEHDVDGGQIVDIVCSSEDVDIVYVADDTYVYWTEDGGDKWTAVADASLAAAIAAADDDDDVLIITALDVGYIGGDPYVFISTRDDDTGGAGYDGTVFFINQEDYLAGWIDMKIQDYEVGLGDTLWDVYAVNCAPDFDDSHKIFAVVTTDDEEPSNGSNDPLTQVVTNTGTAGAWTQFGGDLYEVTGPPSTDPIEIDGASDICFPDDFDDDELFVGVSSTTDEGSVYRVVADIAYAYRLGNYDSTIEDVDIISLDITGDVGATLLLAGAQEDAADNSESADVFYSTDDGEGWDDAGKAPSGEDGMAYVLMAEDFIDSDTPSAWAATSGNECAISYTIDGGDLFNQISLINTDMDEEIESFSHYPDYETSEKMFMVTSDDGDDSLWRYDGEYWERVACSDVLGSNTAGWPIFVWVEVSPEIGSDETVYLTDWALWGDPDIYRSTNEGQSWKKLRCQPDDFYGGIVLDDETGLAGGSSLVYRTTDHGNRVWKDIDPGIDGDIYWFARFGDNVLAASWSGEVALSEDLGETWDQLGKDIDIGAGDIYVDFDSEYASNSFVYAASTTDIYRFEVGESAHWKDIGDVGQASGIATADGCLYVSDYVAGEGMWRSVNPTAKTPLFEPVNDTAPFDLDDDANIWWLQTTSGSNVLWALETTTWPPVTNTGDLWTYEDALVGPVELDSPSTGTSLGRLTAVTLTWDELDDADDYEVMVYSDEDFKTAYKHYDKATLDDDPLLRVPDLAAGTTYWWKVRVAESEPLVSKWSSAWSFTTAMGGAEWNPFSGPVNEYPWMGATDVPLAPSFAWNVADWATGYEFELADNDAFTDAFTKTLTTTVYQYETNLDYFTTYYWKVRAVSATSTSNWATGVFTTMEKPIEVVAPPPPVEIPPLPAPITPAWIWAIVIIGAVLVIAVIILIVLTRRVP